MWLTDKHYESLVDGSAQAEIQQYMSVDHSADEYNEVASTLTCCYPSYNWRRGIVLGTTDLELEFEHMHKKEIYY